jgi:hypothetical protein
MSLARLPSASHSFRVESRKLTALRRRDEDISKEKALQTLAIGEYSENLLDIDVDAPEAAGPRLASSADTHSPGSPATSQFKPNPLDDLLGLFDAPISTDQAAKRPLPQATTAATEDLLDGLF